MASISPSSSPRWDNRNTGFVSPSQLQLLKQQEEQQRQHQQQLFQHHRSSTSFPEQREQSTPARAEQGQPTMFRTTSKPDIAPAPPTGHTHSRTTSAFSFFKSKANHNHTPSTTSLPHATGEHGELRNGQGLRPSPSTSSRGPAPSGPPPNSSNEQPPASGPAASNQGTPASKPPAGGPPPGGLPPLHPEIRSIVQLTVAQTQKVYFSGPLVRRVERQPDGQRSTKDEGWREVWAQLGGTTLSVWDMKEIEEASKQGRQVPPSYVNVTDAFIEVHGSVTTPASPTSPSQKYTNVLALNNAGSNLLLFACPNTQSLLSWAAAMRLSAWEKSRLEEIYSAHLIRITLNDGRDTPSPLTHGRMEGWVRIRVAGQTDWKRLWMVVSAGMGPPTPHEAASSEAPTVLRKKRISSLFGRDQSPPRPSSPKIPALQLFTSNKPKDKKKPVLSMCKVTQAFAVYPERPELISRSTLMKVEGTLGEELAGAMQSQEGWLLVMPELEGNNTRASEMLKWLTGIHDAFELYGRPRMYNWDPRDPRSMMFAYPIGPNRDMLFLDRELAETLDPTEAHTSTTRARLQRILWERMGGSPEQSQSPIGKQAPTLPPLPELSFRDDPAIAEKSQASGSQPLQLPPLQFETSRVEQDLPEIPPQLPRTLTPITEKSDPRHSRPGSNEGAVAQPMYSPPANGLPEQSVTTRPKAEATKPTSFFGDVMTTSPIASSPPPISDFRGERRSEDSFAVGTSSRPDSKLSHFPVRQPTSPISPQQTLDSSSSYTQNTDRDRQSPALTSPRPFSITPPPPILAAAKPSSRPASPRPSVPASHHDSTRAASPSFSVLTSPHSVAEPQSPIAVRRQSRLSLMQESPPSPGAQGHGRNVSGSSSLAIQLHPTTPTSKLATQPPATPSSPLPPLTSLPSATPPSTSQAPVPPSKDNSSPELSHEAGALYYMRLQQGDAFGPRRQPPPPADDNEESASSDESGSVYSPTPAATTRTGSNSRSANSPRFASPAATSSHAGTSSSYFPPQTQPQGSTSTSSGQSSGKPVVRPAVSPDPGVSSRGSRRPSGARAVPVSKTATAHRELAPATTQQHLPPQPLPPLSVDEDDEDEDMTDDEQNSEERGPRLLPPRLAKAEAEAAHDDQHGAADMLAALSFLERVDQPPPPSVQSPTAKQPKSPPPVPQLVEPRAMSPTPSAQGSLRSSFAPSRKAEERKAKSQAQQAAYEAAVHKPGRANGRQKKKMRDAGAWGESSDEEEEEEEEEDEDEDADSDEEPQRRDGGRVDQRGLASPARPGGRAVSPGGPVRDGSPASQYRPPRDLPPVPMGQGYPGMGPGPGPSGSEDNLAPQPRRFVSDQFSEAGRRSMYPDPQRRQPSPQPQGRGQSEYLQPGAARQNMWSQVLERDPAALPESNSRDTFVQIEPPSQTMTKAFAPHGLLSAGLQDKQDRSAKRQEELARETGASLINVPHKPPPPQTGLLGAVTAHERERKREGGLGATLTERERERRLAEERQRKLDEFQRMQLDQMQQTGSMYGGMGMPQFAGYNPMMGNPMMMGMNPMMSGGWGYPGMMNPQHMFAAQQAAQAYQQAMAAFSTAGSQVGGDGGNVPQMNPMMTGAMSFDPRMSMMGMPMLSPSMTGMGGMNPAMGMGGMGGMGGGVSPMGTPMGMGQMGMGGMGMNPQMTGGSAFDARYSPGNDGGLRAPSEIGGSRPYSQNSSAHGQGSPAGGPRPLDGGDDAKKPSAGIR